MARTGERQDLPDDVADALGVSGLLVAIPERRADHHEGAAVRGQLRQEMAQVLEDRRLIEAGSVTVEVGGNGGLLDDGSIDPHRVMADHAEDEVPELLPILGRVEVVAEGGVLPHQLPAEGGQVVTDRAVVEGDRRDDEVARRPWLA